MTTGLTKEPRRVLLGLGSGGDLRISIEVAAVFASAVKSGLLCVLVQQEDILNLAGLPFAKVYGRGGFSTTLTLHSIESHFNQLVRTAERALAESCARTHVAWQMLRPQGMTFREISTALEEGDIVVVNRHDIQISGLGLFDVAKLFLDRAAAVVVPSSALKLNDRIVVISDGPGTAQAIAIAQGIGLAAGIGIEIMGASDFLHFHGRASVVVAPMDIVAPFGEIEFLRKIAAAGATAVLVSE
jgi:hypothetical protein